MATNKIPVGIELYSVRKTLTNDLEGTLDAVKSFGYDAVEFAGKPQYDAARVADALKASGLYVSSWHVPYDSLLTTEERFNETVEYHQAVGNKYLIIPHLPSEWLNSLDAIKKSAEKLNTLSDKLKKYGMYTGYHNHSKEFAKLPDADLTAWSAIRENTNDRFIMQIDTGNALAGNADLNDELSKAAGRSQIVHIKPYSREKGFATMIGNPEDDNDYNFILPFCKEKGGTFIYIIEYECETLYSDMEGVELCIKAFKDKFGDLL